MSKYIDVEPIIEWAKDPEANLPYGASGVDWEQKIFNAPTIDIDLADDGTLSVEVDDATKVKRVLVEDGKYGDLYYADRPQEWIPCSERLPSKGVAVLVNGIMYDAPPITISTDAPYYYERGWINAWMPLPKPWEGADDE